VPPCPDVELGTADVRAADFHDQVALAAFRQRLYRATGDLLATYGITDRKSPPSPIRIAAPDVTQRKIGIF
jgi:hypothetical protein